MVIPPGLHPVSVTVTLDKWRRGHWHSQDLSCSTGSMLLDFDTCGERTKQRRKLLVLEEKEVERRISTGLAGTNHIILITRLHLGWLSAWLSLPSLGEDRGRNSENLFLSEVGTKRALIV